MIIAFKPESVVQDAEKLQRLAEVARAVTRHAGENLDNIVAPLSAGLFKISV